MKKRDNEWLLVHLKGEGRTVRIQGKLGLPSAISIDERPAGCYNRKTTETGQGMDTMISKTMQEMVKGQVGDPGDV